MSERTPHPDGPSDDRRMKRWMVWLIVGGPFLVYFVGRLLVGN